MLRTMPVSRECPSIAVVSYPNVVSSVLRGVRSTHAVFSLEVVRVLILGSFVLVLVVGAPVDDVWLQRARC